MPAVIGLVGGFSGVPKVWITRTGWLGVALRYALWSLAALLV